MRQRASKYPRDDAVHGLVDGRAMIEQISGAPVVLPAWFGARRLGLWAWLS